jgi:hypothetical protein
MRKFKIFSSGAQKELKAERRAVTDFVLKPFDLRPFLELITHSVRPLVKRTPMEVVEILNRKLSRLLDAHALTLRNVDP